MTEPNNDDQDRELPQITCKDYGPVEPIDDQEECSSSSEERIR